MEVREIPKPQARPWIEQRHYARRYPKIYFSYGLFDGEEMIGVCAFGPCARKLNNGYGVFGGKLEVRTIELNRLIVEDGLPKNTLSKFVSECFKLLPKPMCVVSYADGNAGHHGYIYQATNWIYTGETQKEAVYLDNILGKTLHPRQVFFQFGTRVESKLPKHITVSREAHGKHRYFIFLGNKTEVKEMRKNLKYKILPYPKGENTRYDTGFVVHTLPIDLLTNLTAWDNINE